MNRTVESVALGGFAMVVVTLACYALQFDLASAIPVYMLLVIVQALTEDFHSAVVMVVLSAGCLDFFFTQPRFSLYVRNPLNVVALIGFIVTGLIAINLVFRQVQEARSAKLRKERLDRLYKLSEQLVALDPDVIMTEKFLEPFHELFGVTAICTFDAETAKLLLVGVSRQNLGSMTREAYISGHNFSDRASRLSVRCLRVTGRGRMTGAIGFEGVGDSEEATGSLAALTAALVERAKVFRQATAAVAAAQAEVYRSAMLDALAHEIKTPLATILTAAGGILEAGPLGVAQQEMAETVEREVVRLDHLTSRLLRIARLDRQDIKPRMESIDLGSLVGQIATQYSERSPDQQILFKSPHEVFEVQADTQLLRIALSQLVENACKYSAPGSIVSIEIGREDHSVAVKVANTGSSIPYNERDRIFERFYRGADAVRSTSGSGLGLYVARKIAIAHGGSLDLKVQSQPNDMTTFCLRIPAQKEAATNDLATKWRVDRR